MTVCSHALGRVVLDENALVTTVRFVAARGKRNHPKLSRASCLASWVEHPTHWQRWTMSARRSSGIEANRGQRANIVATSGAS